MSLNATDKLEAAGAAAQVTVPRLTASGYAAWRPQMENALLRAGIAERDYKEKNDDWPALVAAVDTWVRADERASIEFALGRMSAGAAKGSSAAGPTAAEKEARRGVVEMVARTKKAYALLFHALSDELRRLVASVPQGCAYGLWSWLEKRFQSTEQDNVGDLWDQFTKMEQSEEESFDEYKARVDHVHGLLAHAKDKPSPGLYTHRLLWKLLPQYTPAVLALKASGKLKEPEKIVWDEIASFINNHERSQQRLSERDDHGLSHAMALTSTRRYGPGKKGGNFACFNCGENGHLSRQCSKPRRARRDEGPANEEQTITQGKQEKQQSAAASSGASDGAGGAKQRAYMMRPGTMRTYALTSDDEDYAGPELTY
jgi:hypothetical protein